MVRVGGQNVEGNARQKPVVYPSFAEIDRLPPQNQRLVFKTATKQQTHESATWNSPNASFTYVNQHQYNTVGYLPFFFSSKTDYIKVSANSMSNCKRTFCAELAKSHNFSL